MLQVNLVGHVRVQVLARLVSVGGEAQGSPKPDTGAQRPAGARRRSQETGCISGRFTGRFRVGVWVISGFARLVDSVLAVPWSTCVVFVEHPRWPSPRPHYTPLQISCSPLCRTLHASGPNIGPAGPKWLRALEHYPRAHPSPLQRSG